MDYNDMNENEQKEAKRRENAVDFEKKNIDRLEALKAKKA